MGLGPGLWQETFTAEISEHEYDALMRAIDASATSNSALITAVNALHVELASKYLPRDEDLRSDEERFTAVYNFIRVQYDGLAKRLDDAQQAADSTHADMNRATSEAHLNIWNGINLLRWVSGILFLFVLALMGAVIKFTGA